MGGKITREEKPAVDTLNMRLLENIKDQTELTITQVTFFNEVLYNFRS